MAFPSDVLGTKVQLQIDGTWTDVVRYDANTKVLESSGVSINRGQGGLDPKTKAGVCQWTWQDPNGVYLNENPRSPYFNMIPRNTPVRTYVPRETTSMLIVDRNDGARAETADKAGISITGDIEIRIDFEPKRWARWASGTNKVMLLASKYSTSGSQRSWYVRFGEPMTANGLGSLVFVWSTGGTSGTTTTVGATEDIPIPQSGRLAVKITMDVNNGAGGHTIRFYTAEDGIDGTYTQLGTDVTLSGVTSIFDSTSSLEIGTFQDGGLDFAVSSQVYNFVGRVYGFRLYNGIGGSLVANADFTAQAVGTTSFSDGLGNTWDLFGVAEITDADYRFHGEFSAPVLVPNRTRDGTGVDVKIQAEAGGILRRISANATPLQSPIALTFANYSPVGWWPGEASGNGVSTPLLAGAGAEGIPQAAISGIEYEGFDEEIPGSAGVFECTGASPTFSGFCKNSAVTGESHFYVFFKFPSTPASDVLAFTWYNTGTVRKFTLTVGSGVYRLQGYDFENVQLFSLNTLHGAGATPNQWIAYHSRSIQNGGNVDTSHEWFVVDSDTYFSGGVGSTAGTAGRHTRITISGTGMSGVRFCHPMLSNEVGLEFYSGTPSLNAVNYARGFGGELADARFRRICALLGVEPVVVGNLDDTEPLGPQPIASGINILYQIPEVDGGLLVEAADQLALEYHTRSSLQNKNTFTVTWAQLAEGLRGTPDDTDVANDISMTSDVGNARATLEYGPMSIQAPPNGINPVPDGPSVNAYTANQVRYLAQYYLFTHTWPTSRYPAVNINMHHPSIAGDQDLFNGLMRLDIGDVLQITDLPDFMAPEELQLLIRGRVETQYGQQWELQLVTVPYGPYIGSELQTRDDAPYSNFRASQHTDEGVVQTQLNADITNSATSIAIKTLSGPLLEVGAVSPSYRIKIDGEFMDVTNVAGTSSPQTVTVTRGVVGGYAAAHSANAYVYLYPTLKAKL